MIRIDIMKVLLMLVMAGAWWLGQVPWWLPIASVCWFWSVQWQYVLPSVRREAEKEIAVQRALFELQQRQALTANAEGEKGKPN